MPDTPNEPMIKLEPGGVAPVLSYNVPEPTSYSGRNFIDLQLGDSYFKNDDAPTAASSKSLESLVTGAAGERASAGRASLMEGTSGTAETPSLAVALKAVDAPPSPKLATLDLAEVRAMQGLGKQLCIYRSLYGTLTYTYIEPPAADSAQAAGAPPVSARAGSNGTEASAIDSDPGGGGGGGGGAIIAILVEITGPQSGATVNGPSGGAALHVTGVASVQRGGGSISTVSVRVGSADFQLATPVAANNWATWSYDTVVTTPGELTIEARAAHSTGKTATHSITVQVALAPPADTTAPGLGITYPENGQELPGTSAGSAAVNVAGTASDVQSGVRLVEVKIDDGQFSEATRGGPDWASWTKVVNLTGAGFHAITARSTDNAGNITTKTVSVKVVAAPPADTTDPAVNITAPAPNAEIAGPFNGASISVTGTASDVGGGVSKVEVLVGGIATPAQPRAAGDWSTWAATVMLRETGLQMIVARCTDSSGNESASAVPVNVTLIPDVDSRLKRLILVESYRLSSYLGSYGAGRTIKTFSLLPGEKTKISIKTFTKTEEDAKSASSILDSFTQESSDDFEESMGEEQSNKKNYDESFQYKVEATAQASWGWGSAGISGGLSGGTNSAREDFSKNISNATQKHVAKASAKRDVKIETSYEVKTSEGEETSVERVIENINVSRTLNFVFRQMNQEFITLLHLVDARVGYFNVVHVQGQPEPRYSYREATLPELDALLAEVVVPEKQAEVRADIVRQLSNIFDYKDRHHRFAEEEPLTDRDGKIVPLSQYLRVRKDYTSTYLDEATGTQLTVPGIIMAASKYVLRTEGVIVEALLGQGDSLDAYSHGLQDESVEERRLANERAKVEIEKERLALQIIQSKNAEAAKLFALLYPPPTQLVPYVPPAPAPASQEAPDGKPVRK
ncbi:MAG TPA: hypothetical protein VF240_03605 [Pyrinomonadaceae bacterium]